MACVEAADGDDRCQSEGNAAVARDGGQLSLGETRVDGRLWRACLGCGGRQDSLLCCEGCLTASSPSQSRTLVQTLAFSVSRCGVSLLLSSSRELGKGRW